MATIKSDAVPRVLGENGKPVDVREELVVEARRLHELAEHMQMLELALVDAGDRRSDVLEAQRATVLVGEAHRLVVLALEHYDTATAELEPIELHDDDPF